jgi:hypothetical protein
MTLWEWIPETFEDFLTECQHVVSHCLNLGHLILYRGQRERKWLLDSTFVRSLKHHVFGIESWHKIKFDDFRLSAQHQQFALNLFFLKFDFLAQPSQQLYDVAKEHGLDPWFEFMKRIQQYPEEDTSHLKGSFLVDWTQNVDIALYFANEFRRGEGALWICDATATGKTLQTITVEKILKKMNRMGKRNKSLGIPLIFHPKKQANQKRATNQEPVYVAQMDLRVDLSEVWDNFQQTSEQILVKLILPAATEEAFFRYLQDKKMTREFLFPD